MISSYIKGFLFLTSWLFPLVPWLGYEYLGISWAMPVLLFLILGPLSVAIGQDKTQSLSTDKLFSFSGTYFKLIPRLFFLFYIFGGMKVLEGLQDCSIIDAIFLIMSWGLVSAVATISLHEMGDSFSTIDKAIEATLCALIGYGHFSKENMAHHFEEGSYEMGYVAEKGENVFSFMRKQIPLGFKAAFSLEKKLLTAQDKGRVSNTIFQNYALTLVFAMMINEVFGLIALTGYAIQLVICVIAASVVAYMQHYGLPRPDSIEADASFAWEGNNFVDNIVMLNMTRHSHHHMRQHLPYYLLRHSKNSPKLPYGYPLMVLVALIPPLWFSIMDPRLDTYNRERKFLELDVIV